MTRGYFHGGADEAGDGAGTAGLRPGRQELAGAEVGDRDDGQAGRAVLTGGGDRDVGDGVAKRHGV